MRDHQLKGTEMRLWDLVEERTNPGADTKRIDQRIWDLFGDEAAILFTDLSGFSRQVAAFGIIHFLQVIFESRRIMLPIVHDHDGILIKAEADSLLLVFKRADAALRCAIAMQHACQATSKRRTPEEQVLLCIGGGFGKILRVGDADVYGQEVNAASKLGEDTAKRDEILVTGSMRDALGDFPGVHFVDLGQSVPGSEKNFRVVYEKLG
jgi:class 3 adenylate cyclase